jgi:hypothetical protein
LKYSVASWDAKAASVVVSEEDEEIGSFSSMMKK